MFERFTDRARRTVTLGQEEVLLLGHSYYGPEHLLLGLLHEGEGVAAQALIELGVGLEDARRAIDSMPSRMDHAPGSGAAVPFTPRLKKVFELGLREALQLGHNYIGTEHLLLGILREGESAAAQVLHDAGLELSAVRQKVIAILSGYRPEPNPLWVEIKMPYDEAVRLAEWLEKLSQLVLSDATPVGGQLRRLRDALADVRA